MTSSPISVSGLELEGYTPPRSPEGERSWRGRIVAWLSSPPKPSIDALVQKSLALGVRSGEGEAFYTSRAVTPPIRYVKGETKTRNFPLARTSGIFGPKKLGQGFYGSVYVTKGFSDLAVKKSSHPMEMEYVIGNKLSHPSLVKSRALFIKQRSTGGLTYKLVMDRIQGYVSAEALMKAKTTLSKDAILQLLDSAKDVCLYLFDQGVYWWDINDGNIYIDKDKAKLLFADFGLWGEALDPNVRGCLLLGELRRAVLMILDSSMPQKISLEGIHDESPLPTSIGFPIDELLAYSSTDVRAEFGIFGLEDRAVFSEKVSSYIDLVKRQIPD